ncbi:YveK family protein [Kocuria sp. M1R5S2]|uniref:YveK family protein n=1 Tax=Kocuria rhizosphaerae TaxID=3376285 RepID=UPI00378ECE26
MEPLDYLVALRRHWIVILVLTALGVGGGALLAANTEPTYEARSSVLLTPSPGVATHELGEVGNYMNYQIHSYAELTNSRVVLDEVARDVDLPYGVDVLADRVGAQVPVNTSIINITVTDTDRGRASQVANSVAAHLVTAVEDAAPKPEADSTTLDLRTVARAVTPQDPVAPRLELHLAGGGALGLFLGVLLAVARHALLRARLAQGSSRPGPGAEAGPRGATPGAGSSTPAAGGPAPAAGPTGREPAGRPELQGARP